MDDKHVLWFIIFTKLQFQHIILYTYIIDAKRLSIILIVLLIDWRILCDFFTWEINSITVFDVHVL